MEIDHYRVWKVRHIAGGGPFAQIAVKTGIFDGKGQIDTTAPATHRRREHYRFVNGLFKHLTLKKIGQGEKTLDIYLDHLYTTINQPGRISKK